MDNTPVQIRLATTDDLNDIQLCAQEAYAKYVKPIGQKPAPMIADFSNQIKLEQIYLALYVGSFAGYVVFYPQKRHLHLESVAVIASQSGKGIGKKLIEYVEQSARENSLECVELYTNEMMKENLAIYPKLGYVETERRQQDGFDRVFFRKVV